MMVKLVRMVTNYNTGNDGKVGKEIYCTGDNLHLINVGEICDQTGKKTIAKKTLQFAQ